MLLLVFAAGFVIMTPLGPVSTICIRRALIYGPIAGIVAGAGDAAAVATYATVGVAGSTLLPHYFANFATLWHVGIAVVLIAVAIVIWRSRPTLPTVAVATPGNLAAGFVAPLVIVLANPADVVLFAALFAGLGIVVHTPLDHAVFYATIFAGGCTYWVVLSLFLSRWRSGLTLGRVVWLNRACSVFMFVGAIVSVVSVMRTPGA